MLDIPTLSYNFRALVMILTMATLTGLDPREKMGKTEGLFWGQKALDVSKRQRKRWPADKIENQVD